MAGRARLKIDNLVKWHTKPKYVHDRQTMTAVLVRRCQRPRLETSARAFEMEPTLFRSLQCAAGKRHTIGCTMVRGICLATFFLVDCAGQLDVQVDLRVTGFEAI